MTSFLQILGGMALFLFGVRLLSTGMEKIAGYRLQEWLDRMINRPIKGAVFGAGATALVQSSSAITGLVVAMGISQVITLPGRSRYSWARYRNLRHRADRFAAAFPSFEAGSYRPDHHQHCWRTDFPTISRSFR